MGPLTEWDFTVRSYRSRMCRALKTEASEGRRSRRWRFWARCPGPRFLSAPFAGNPESTFQCSLPGLGVSEGAGQKCRCGRSLHMCSKQMLPEQGLATLTFGLAEIVTSNFVLHLWSWASRAYKTLRAFWLKTPYASALSEVASVDEQPDP